MSFDKQKVVEEYELDKLEDLRELGEDYLEENTDLSEDERFAATAVASVRHSGFPFMAREMATKTNTDLDRVKSGIEELAEEWDNEYISTETVTGFAYLFLNNYNRSEDMIESVKTLDKEVVSEYDSIREKLEEYEAKVGAASLIYVAGHITHWDIDDFSFEELAQKFDVPVHKVHEAYREVWDKNEFSVDDSVVGGQGLLADVRNIADEMDLDNDTKDQLFYYTLNVDKQDREETYNNKASAGAIVYKVTGMDAEEVAEYAEANKGAIKRIAEKF